MSHDTHHPSRVRRAAFPQSPLLIRRIAAWIPLGTLALLALLLGACASEGEPGESTSAVIPANYVGAAGPTPTSACYVAMHNGGLGASCASCLCGRCPTPAQGCGGGEPGRPVAAGSRRGAGLRAPGAGAGPRALRGRVLARAPRRLALLGGREVQLLRVDRAVLSPVGPHGPLDGRRRQPVEKPPLNELGDERRVPEGEGAPVVHRVSPELIARGAEESWIQIAS